MVGHSDSDRESGYCKPNPRMVDVVGSLLDTWRRQNAAKNDADPDEAVRWAVNKAKELIAMDSEQGYTSGGVNEARTMAMPAVDYEIEDTGPAQLTLCKAVQIYGKPDGKGWRGRLVIAQDTDPRFWKLTITEPDGKGGFKSVSVRLDIEGWKGMKDSIAGYGNEVIPAPSDKPARADQVARLQREIQAMGRAFNEQMKRANALEEELKRRDAENQARRVPPTRPGNDYEDAPTVIGKAPTLRGNRSYAIEAPGLPAEGGELPRAVLTPTPAVASSGDDSL